MLKLVWSVKSFLNQLFKVQHSKCLHLAKKSRVGNGLNGIYSKKISFPQSTPTPSLELRCWRWFMMYVQIHFSSLFLSGSHEPPSGLVCGLFTYALWHELFFILFYFHHNFISSFAILSSYRPGAFRRIPNENIIKYLKTENIMKQHEKERSGYRMNHKLKLTHSSCIGSALNPYNGLWRRIQLREMWEVQKMDLAGERKTKAKAKQRREKCSEFIGLDECWALVWHYNFIPQPSELRDSNSSKKDDVGCDDSWRTMRLI